MLEYSLVKFLETKILTVFTCINANFNPSIHHFVHSGGPALAAKLQYSENNNENKIKQKPSLYFPLSFSNGVKKEGTVTEGVGL